jgi:hypothetical protein
VYKYNNYECICCQNARKQMLKNVDMQDMRCTRRIFHPYSIQTVLERHSGIYITLCITLFLYVYTSIYIHEFKDSGACIQRA